MLCQQQSIQTVAEGSLSISPNNSSVVLSQITPFPLWRMCGCTGRGTLRGQLAPDLPKAKSVQTSVKLRNAIESITTFVLQGFHAHPQLFVSQALLSPYTCLFPVVSFFLSYPQQPKSYRLDGVTVVDEMVEIAASQFISKTSHWPFPHAWFRPKPIIFSLS